jgi:large subunit ribosomal protein L29
MAKSTLNVSSLRGLSQGELEAKLGTMRQELWQFTQKVKTGTDQQVHKIRVMRRDIARVQTVLREQKLAK